MIKKQFEGTLILEKLTEINKLEAFYDAIDSDDFSLVKNLMIRARIDSEVIQAIMEEIIDVNGVENND
ncbi:MAG: hypothetical protein ACK5W9_06620 [Bdellovibrionales bacterium]